MLSLIQHDVVETHNWISVADFTDIVAISQSTPGPIAFNTATYIGYTATGSIWGSAICTIAVSLPSLIIMITISKFFFMFRDNKYVEMAMQGLKITVLWTYRGSSVVIDEQTKLRGLQKLYNLRHSLHRHLQIQNGPDTHDHSGRSGRVHSLLEAIPKVILFQKNSSVTSCHLLYKQRRSW